jgi:hypothetical protein
MLSVTIGPEIAQLFGVVAGAVYVWIAGRLYFTGPVRRLACVRRDLRAGFALTGEVAPRRTETAFRVDLAGHSLLVEAAQVSQAGTYRVRFAPESETVLALEFVEAAPVDEATTMARQRQALDAILRIDEAARAANRQGRLSARQCSELLTGSIPRFIAFVFFGGVAVTCCVGSWRGQTFWPTVFALLPLALTIHYARRAIAHLVDGLRGVVRVVEGPVTKIVTRRTHGQRGYYVEIAGARAEAPDGAHEALLLEGVHYRMLYTPWSRHVVDLLPMR